MSLPVRLVDLFNNVLGASWFAPIRTSFFGEGTGVYYSPVDFTATPKSDGKIYITGLPVTITNLSQFRSVKTYDPGGALIGEYYPCEQTPFFWDAVGSFLVLGNVEFANVAFVVVELAAQHRAYAPTEDAYQQYGVNPEHAWTASSTLVDDTNITDATVYYYLDWDMYKYGGLQLSLDGDAGTVTATLECSYQDDGTAQASASYQDTTLALTGVASLVAAAAPATAMWIIDTPQSFKFLRVKVVYATTGNTGDATIYARQTY